MTNVRGPERKVVINTRVNERAKAESSWGQRLSSVIGRDPTLGQWARNEAPQCPHCGNHKRGPPRGEATHPASPGLLEASPGALNLCLSVATLQDGAWDPYMSAGERGTSCWWDSRGKGCLVTGNTGVCESKVVGLPTMGVLRPGYTRWGPTATQQADGGPRRPRGRPEALSVTLLTLSWMPPPPSPPHALGSVGPACLQAVVCGTFCPQSKSSRMVPEEERPEGSLRL